MLPGSPSGDPTEEEIDYDEAVFCCVMVCFQSQFHKLLCQHQLHTWSNSVSSLSRSCSKNLSNPWALKMRSDSSEKRTASPSNATLSWDSDTSVSFSGMNMVAAAMPGHKHRQKLKAVVVVLSPCPLHLMLLYCTYYTYFISVTALLLHFTVLYSTFN